MNSVMDSHPAFVGARRVRITSGVAWLIVASIVVAAAFNLTLGLIGVVVMFFTNMWFYYRKARHLSVYIPALRILVRMIEAARVLPWDGLNELPAKVAAAKRASGWLLTGAPSPSPTFSGDITEVVLLYIKIYFQIDLQGCWTGRCAPRASELSRPQETNLRRDNSVQRRSRDVCVA